MLTVSSLQRQHKPKTALSSVFNKCLDRVAVTQRDTVLVITVKAGLAGHSYSFRVSLRYKTVTSVFSSENIVFVIVPATLLSSNDKNSTELRLFSEKQADFTDSSWPRPLLS